MLSSLIGSFILSVIFAVILTPRVAAWAKKRGVVDVPDVPTPPTPSSQREGGKEKRFSPSTLEGEREGVAMSRRFHSRPTPLLGGIGIYLAFTIALGLVAWWTRVPFEGRINPMELLAVFLCGLILVIGGYLDDRYHLRPARQFLFPLLAVAVVAAAGVGISRITNPFGGVIYLAPWITVAFTVAWLLGTTYTMKLLDGLDGLVSGITAIGALLIAALSLTSRYYQPDVAVIALALAGATLGFLIFNFHPARIFLGEGGSTLCGFLLGVLAIISGGKVATALLVMGIPAVDVALVIGQRLFRHGGVTQGDRSHLHFRLLDLGFSHRGAVLFLYVLAAGFGMMTLFLQAQEKLVAIGVLVVLATVLSFSAAMRKHTPRAE